MRRRVVVTGIGCVTPLGTDIETMWRRLLAGESGVGYTTLFDASNFPTKISAEVRDWDLSDVGENPEDWKYQGRHTHFAVGAAKKAMADSGLELDKVDPTRFGVYTGSGEGQQDFDRFTQMMIAGLDGGDKLDVDEVHPQGPGNAAPDRRVGARAEHAGRPPGQPLQRPGAEPQLPDGLRRQQPGGGRGGRDHPPRRGRPDAFRRHAHDDPSLRRHRLQSADGPEHPQRRADQGVAPVRPRPRRFRAGRRGRHGGSRIARTRPGPRGEDSRRDRRLRLDGRRLPHHRHASRGPRRDQLHENGAGRRRAWASTTSITSTPTAPAPR